MIKQSWYEFARHVMKDVIVPTLFLDYAMCCAQGNSALFPERIPNASRTHPEDKPINQHALCYGKIGVMCYPFLGEFTLFPKEPIIFVP